MGLPGRFGFALLFLVLLAPTALGVVGLGHMQPVQEITIPLGQRYTTPIYFYNAYGDRLTHVVLTITSASEPIRVSLDPEAHVAQYNLSGLVVNVTENVLACPWPNQPLPPGAQASLEQPVLYDSRDPNCPGRVAYILAPRGDSYLPSSVVNVTFEVPEDTPVGTYPVRLEASGFILGERGNVQPGIGGVFDYTIFVRRPGPLTEAPVTPTPPTEKAPGLDIAGLLPTIGIALAVVGAMAGMYMLGRRGRS